MGLPKNPKINCHAPGYWGGRADKRIAAELVPDKVLSLNYDKVMAMGLPYALWREASFMRDGLSQCSCFKDTSKQPDIPCQSCYGTGYIPGYFKFGTRNYWSASVDAGWTLSGVVLDRTNRPNRFMLDSSATTGTAISTNQVVSVYGKLGEWEAKAEAFTRETGGNSTITVEVSSDNGVTWFALAQIATCAPTVQIKFKVTMTRTATTVKSPMFEIVRARFATIFDIRGELEEPVIRVIPTWLNEAEYRENYGDKLEAKGNAFWTMPMAIFDTSLDLDEPRSRIQDDAFVEVRYGGETGFRYTLIDFSYSDTFNKFTRQAFSLRKVTGQPGKMVGESYYRVW